MRFSLMELIPILPLPCYRLTCTYHTHIDIRDSLCTLLLRQRIEPRYAVVYGAVNDVISGPV